MRARYALSMVVLSTCLLLSACGDDGDGIPKSTLKTAMDAQQTTVPLVDSAEFPSSGMVRIDQEWMSYSGKQAGSLVNVVRGAFDTDAVAHAPGAMVEFVGPVRTVTPGGADSTPTRTSPPAPTSTRTATTVIPPTPTRTNTSPPATTTSTATATPTVETPGAPTHTVTSTHTPVPPTNSPTVTPSFGGAAVCGNNAVEAPEMCDNGSVCVEGDKVPEVPENCSQQSDCHEGETCVAKYPPESIAESGGVCVVICQHDAECGGSRGKCMPVGGDGCSANCTTESDIVQEMQDLTWAAIQFQSLFMELAPRGYQVFTIGKARSDTVVQVDGRVIFNPYEVPIAVKARTFQMDEINVPNLACACLRGYEAPRYGPGNSAEGKFTCSDLGLDGIDAYLLSDHRYSGPGQCTDYHDLGLTGDYVEARPGKIDVKPGHEGQCNVANAYTLNNRGPKGSAMLRMTLALSFQQFPSRPQACTPADPSNPHPWFGPDGKACTEDDPDKGVAMLVPSVTGFAKADIINSNNVDGRVMAAGSKDPCKKTADCTALHPNEQCFNDIGEKCGLRDECTCLIPCGTVPCFTEATGHPLRMCENPSDLLNGSCLAGSFGRFDEAIGDMFVVLNMCSGDIE